MEQTAVETLIEIYYGNEGQLTIKDLEKAKAMEKEQKQRFNKFLNDEMELGISDKKTIERIKWYYNNYLFNL